MTGNMNQASHISSNERKWETNMRNRDNIEMSK